MKSDYKVIIAILFAFLIGFTANLWIAYNNLEDRLHKYESINEGTILIWNEPMDSFPLEGDGTLIEAQLTKGDTVYIGTYYPKSK